jgi:hypothetical protein
LKPADISGKKEGISERRNMYIVSNVRQIEVRKAE